MKLKNQIFAILVLICSNLFSQQNDDYKFNYENQFINNPAALSSFNELRISTYYLKQFTAIENAPTDMFLSFQTPIPYQKASVGIAIIRETAGLLDNIRINLSGAYKLSALFSSNDYLSFGLGVNYTNFGISGSQIDLTQNGDPFQNIGNERASSVNLGVGTFYSSTSFLDYRGKSLEYQIGLSGAKTVPQSINFKNFTYQESMLFSGFSAFFIPLTEGTYLNPYFDIQVEVANRLNQVSSGAILSNVNLGLRSVYNNSLILGVTIDNGLALGFQAGYKSPSIINSGVLQIIAQTLFPLGQIDNNINSGFGISIQYIFNMTNYL